MYNLQLLLTVFTKKNDKTFFVEYCDSTYIRQGGHHVWHWPIF